MTPDAWHAYATATLEREQQRDRRPVLMLLCSTCGQSIPFGMWDVHVERKHSSALR
jgi:hypothetical protein